MRGTLKRWARLANWIGALGAIAFLLRTGYREGTPGMLLLMIGAWVVSPFILIALAMHRSRHWSDTTREALYLVAILVGVGTLAVYLRVALVPLRAKPAVPFVALPPIAWIVTILSIAVAALMSRRKTTTS